MDHQWRAVAHLAPPPLATPLRSHTQLTKHQSSATKKIGQTLAKFVALLHCNHYTAFSIKQN